MGQLLALAMSSSSVAATALVPLFAPYCGGVDLVALEAALGLLQQGRFSGERPLRGGEAHCFELSWGGAQAPLELAHCVLRFPQLPEVHYSFAVPAHRLLAWLAATRRGTAALDLPDAFWSWLILGTGDDREA